MKFFVFALLVLVCFEGFYCAPFLELFIPESRQMNYGSYTTFNIPKLEHLQKNSGCTWTMKVPERYPRRENYGYKQQYEDYQQQYEDYTQHGPYDNYGGQH